MSAPKTLRMMPWFPRDFLASTQGWPWAARALYRMLLDAQWELGALPVDIESIKNLSGMHGNSFRFAWRFVERKFPISNNERKNERLEEHRLNAQRLYAQRALGAHTANAQRDAKRTHSSPSHLHPEVSIDTSEERTVKKNGGPMSLAEILRRARNGT